MCAHAVRVAVEKLPGVTEAEVSLEEGLVRIRFDATSEAGVVDIRQAIENQGFSPREADVRVAGRLEEAGDRLALRVPGPTPPYVLDGTAELLGELRTRIGRSVELSGTVPGDAGGAAVRIHVTRIEHAG